MTRVKAKSHPKTPEEIIKILRSISRVEIDEHGVLSAFFEKDQTGNSINGFIPGTFTRELLALIEAELNNELIDE